MDWMNEIEGVDHKLRHMLMKGASVILLKRKRKEETRGTDIYYVWQRI
jgi:hypothetical protein